MTSWNVGQMKILTFESIRQENKKKKREKRKEKEKLRQTPNLRFLRLDKRFYMYHMLWLFKWQVVSACYKKFIYEARWHRACIWLIESSCFSSSSSWKTSFHLHLCALASTSNAFSGGLNRFRICMSDFKPVRPTVWYLDLWEGSW